MISPHLILLLVEMLPQVVDQKPASSGVRVPGGFCQGVEEDVPLLALLPVAVSTWYSTAWALEATAKNRSRTKRKMGTFLFLRFSALKIRNVPIFILPR